MEDDDGFLFLSFFSFFGILSYVKRWKKSLRQRVTCFSYFIMENNAVDNSDDGKQNGSWSDSIFFKCCHALH